MYRHINTGPKSLKVTERPVYGSSRLGSYTRQIELVGELAMHQWPYVQPMQAPLKRYELTDHLGNVNTVVTGRLLPMLGLGVQYQAEVVSAQGYESFGAHLPNRNFQSSNYRWGFNGQEKDDEVYGAEGTSYTAEFWQYDPRAGRRWNLDPVDKPWMSPYHAFSNKPIWNIDPNGANDSPIHDANTGELLGTDDEGLTGDALVMDKKDFKQGMNHDKAVSLDKGVGGLKDARAVGKFSEIELSLPSRPDYDGKLTIEEANDWYRTGQGKPLFTALNKINLNGLWSLGENYVGQVKTANLLFDSGSEDDGLVYGTITLKRYTDHQVRAFSDEYNFEMHNGFNPLNWPRNLETMIGKAIAGKGQSYEINIYGSAKLRPIWPGLK